MENRVTAIINPVSGRRSMEPVVQEIGRLLKLHGGELSIRRTLRAGHATDIAQNLDTQTKAVLVVGGDGTVCEVVNGLIDTHIPIAILRTGTENLLARELGMPTKPADVARTLMQGHIAPFDVGVINERRFVAVAGVGFDAECVVRMTNLRKGHITHGDYFWPVWRTFWSHRFPEIVVCVDDKTLFQGCGLALIGNIARYSMGMRILSEAKYNDGLLDLCVMRCTSRVQLLAHAARVMRGVHINHQDVIYCQCHQCSIESATDVPVEVDGDCAGYLPLRASILPSAVSFLIPS